MVKNRKSIVIDKNQSQKLHLPLSTRLKANNFSREGWDRQQQYIILWIKTRSKIFKPLSHSISKMRRKRKMLSLVQHHNSLPSSKQETLNLMKLWHANSPLFWPEKSPSWQQSICSCKLKPWRRMTLSANFCVIVSWSEPIVKCAKFQEWSRFNYIQNEFIWALSRNPFRCMKHIQ